MGKRVKWMILVGAVLLVSGVAWGVVGARRAAVEVETITVEKGDISTVVSASGETIATKEVALNFKISGKLDEVLVKEGDAVEAGQTLARLDTRDLENQLEQARKQVSVYSAASSSAVVTLSAANKSLGSTQEKTTQDIAAAQSARNAAKASRDWALVVREEAVKEWQDLVKKYEHPIYHLPNYTAAQEAEVDAAKAAADTALTTYLSADASYRAAEEALVTTERGAQVQLTTTGNQVSTARAQYKSALAQLQLGRVGRKMAEDSLSDATLVAPCAGRAISILAEEGEFVSGGAGLSASLTGVSSDFIVLATMDEIQVKADVDEVDIGRVKVGQSANIIMDAYPARVLKGKVVEIALASSTTKGGGIAFPVKILISSVEGVDLRLGMSADVDILVDTKEDVVKVPVESVVRRDGKDLIFVVEDSIAGMRQVELGLSNEDFYEVKKGIKAGERVVTRGASKLKGGERVK
ncbi:MAG: efflux RND transporter periplasmic adaptor subunit [Actinomycetota bacterium]|nr:efflux RND transporter periplasmic adaptor subunit [Actinomycetota bacterium]